MKNKVFALGNALVDYEYQVNDDVLRTIGIDKGSAALAMTLEEQQRILSILKEKDINLLKKAGGGSAANTVFTIAALGGSSSISCRVSDDDEGRFYLQDLTSTGVKTSIQSLSTSPDPTGSCLILVSPDAERTMQSYLGASAAFSYAHVDESLLNRAEYVYIEGYLAASNLAIDAVQQVRKIAKENQIQTALSFADPSMVNFYKQGLLTLIDEGLDILFCNEAEAQAFTETDSVKDAVTKLHEHAKLVVITLGSQGALVSDKNAASFTVSVPSSATVRDTNGAGDNFAGAFMYGITNDLSLEDSAKLAVQVAGELVSHFGPRMAKERYSEILSNFHSSS